MVFYPVVKIPLFLVLGLGAALLAGCDTETIKTYPPTDPREVKVFRHPPKVPYEVMGTLRYVADYAPGNGAVLSMSGTVLDGLREQAAARGADAVILTNQQTIDPLKEDESTKIWLTGTAIHFLKAAPSPRPPSPPGSP